MTSYQEHAVDLAEIGNRMADELSLMAHTKSISGRAKKALDQWDLACLALRRLQQELPGAPHADGACQIDQPAFTNGIRSLFNIDGYLLPELTNEQQLAFVRDPVCYFIGTDKAQQDAIFREVAKRQRA